MLTGKDLGFEVANHDVFSNVTFSVSQGDKVGLIGPNGAGKTTLLKIMSGEFEPTSGLVIREDVEVGMLPQDLRSWSEHSVYGFLEDVTGVKAVKEAYDQAETVFNANPEDEKSLITYVDMAEKLGFFGVHGFDGTVERSIKRAGLSPDVLDREIGDLSGGQRTRVALAAIMSSSYDVVLLDEPTNNLDLEGMAILEKYIKSSKAAFLMVSHDRRFLRNATSRIVELLGGNQGVNHYGLGYDEYVDARLRAYESEVKRFEEARMTIKALEASVRERRIKANSAESGGSRRSDSDKLGANHRAGRAAGNLGKQANALETRLEQFKAEAPHKPQAPVVLSFMFGETEASTQALLDVRDLCVRYDTPSGDQQFGPYNLNVRAGDRIAITGANGTGKSTLIKAIMGELEVAGGKCTVGTGARIAYIDQNQSLPLPDQSPLANLLDLSPGLSRSDAMHLLVKFNLKRDTFSSMRASDLSGGERAKVLLASVAAKKANLLILDEPTNNLDIPTIEGLQDALKTYNGAVVLVSHDRDFIDGIGVTRTIRL